MGSAAAHGDFGVKNSDFGAFWGGFGDFGVFGWGLGGIYRDVGAILGGFGGGFGVRSCGCRPTCRWDLG